MEIESKKPLFDHSKKVFIRIKLNDTKRHWEVWLSKNKRKWELEKSKLSLDDAIKYQQEIIDNNYKNLFNIVTSKKG